MYGTHDYDCPNVPALTVRISVKCVHGLIFEHYALKMNFQFQVMPVGFDTASSYGTRATVSLMFP